MYLRKFINEFSLKNLLLCERIFVIDIINKDIYICIQKIVKCNTKSGEFHFRWISPHNVNHSKIHLVKFTGGECKINLFLILKLNTNYIIKK